MILELEYNLMLATRAVRRAHISTPRIEDLYDEARKAGALGAKVTGAGGGGYLLVYCGRAPSTRSPRAGCSRARTSRRSPSSRRA